MKEKMIAPKGKNEWSWISHSYLILKFELYNSSFLALFKMIKTLIGDIDIRIKENVESSNTFDIDLIMKYFLGFERFFLRKSCKWNVFMLHIMLFMKGKWKFLLLRDNASCCQIKVYRFLHLSLFMLLCITCTLPEVIYRCSIKTFCDKMLWSTTSVGDNGLLDDADMILRNVYRRVPKSSKFWYLNELTT